MCTWGSMNPGKTSLPVASMISAFGGASRSLPMRVMVSFSTKMSARTREPTVTMSAFRMSKAMFHSRNASHHPSSVNMNAHLLAVFFHFLPVLGDFPLRLGDLRPGNRLAPRWFLHHTDAVFHGANVIAEAAANTILLAHVNAGARVHGFFLAIRPHVIRLWLNDMAIFVHQVDALVGRVVASDVAKIAADALLLVDARDGTKRQVKMIEVRDAVQTAAGHVGNICKSLFVQ